MSEKTMKEIDMENAAIRKVLGKTYRYEVVGTDSVGQGWVVNGYVDDIPGELFHHVIQVIESEVFMQLTQGKAVFGRPGLMCKGPYNINSVTITERVNPESFDTGKVNG